MGELLKKLCKEKDIEVNSTMSETKAAFPGEKFSL